MKAIIITAENNHNLPLKKVGEEVRFTENRFPKVWNNTNISYHADLSRFGFYDYVAPIIEKVELSLEQKQINLRSEYSQRISDIVGMKEAIERNMIDGSLIPENILQERLALKDEYHLKLKEL